MPTSTETRPEGHRVPAAQDLDTYEDAAGIKRADSGRPATPPRVAGPRHDAGDRLPLAERDQYALDTATNVRRIVRKGDPIPRTFELLDEEGPEPAESPAEPDKLGGIATTYDSQSKAQLQDEVDRRNAERDDDERIEVDGTGARGDATKPDLVRALVADDERRAAAADPDPDA